MGKFFSSEKIIKFYRKCLHLEVLTLVIVGKQDFDIFLIAQCHFQEVLRKFRMSNTPKNKINMKKN